MSYPIAPDDVRTGTAMKTEALEHTRAEATRHGWGIYGTKRITIDHTGRRVLVELSVEAPERIDVPIWEHVDPPKTRTPRGERIDWSQPHHCTECGRRMRKKQASREDFPGTIQYGSHGICTSCVWAKRTAL